MTLNCISSLLGEYREENKGNHHTLGIYTHYKLIFQCGTLYHLLESQEYKNKRIY